MEGVNATFDDSEAWNRRRHIHHNFLLHLSPSNKIILPNFPFLPSQSLLSFLLSSHTLSLSQLLSFIITIKPSNFFGQVASQSVQPNMEIPQSNTPCYKKKTTEGGFWTNVTDHFGEFVNAPMNRHTICLKKTMRGVTYKIKKSGSMFATTKTDKENDTGAKEAETSPQVQPSGAK